MGIPYHSEFPNSPYVHYLSGCLLSIPPFSYAAQLHVYMQYLKCNVTYLHLESKLLKITVSTSYVHIHTSFYQAMKYRNNEYLTLKLT